MREAWLGRQRAGAVVPRLAAPVPFVPLGRRPRAVQPDRRPGRGHRLEALVARRGDACRCLPSRWAGLRPGSSRCRAARATRCRARSAEQWRAGGVGALAAGSPSGFRMAPGAWSSRSRRRRNGRASIPSWSLAPTGLAPALVRAGASLRRRGASGGAGRAGDCRRNAGRADPRPARGRAAEHRTIEPARGDRHAIGDRAATVARWSRGGSRSASTSGRCGCAGSPATGIYWALRNAGASTATATEYLKALAQRDRRRRDRPARSLRPGVRQPPLGRRTGQGRDAALRGDRPAAGQRPPAGPLDRRRQAGVGQCRDDRRRAPRRQRAWRGRSTRRSPRASAFASTRSCASRGCTAEWISAPAGARRSAPPPTARS